MCWQGKGDYMAVVLHEGLSLSVLLHRISSRTTMVKGVVADWGAKGFSNGGVSGVVIKCAVSGVVIKCAVSGVVIKCAVSGVVIKCAVSDVVIKCAVSDVVINGGFSGVVINGAVSSVVVFMMFLVLVVLVGVFIPLFWLLYYKDSGKWKR